MRIIVAYMRHGLKRVFLSFPSFLFINPSHSFTGQNSIMLSVGTTLC